jgi:hypothetical protein
VDRGEHDEGHEREHAVEAEPLGQVEGGSERQARRINTEQFGQRGTEGQSLGDRRGGAGTGTVVGDAGPRLDALDCPVFDPTPKCWSIGLTKLLKRFTSSASNSHPAPRASSRVVCTWFQLSRSSRCSILSRTGLPALL